MRKTLDVTVSIGIAASTRKCFDYIVPVKLSHIFRPYIFMPGVKYTNETEQWLNPGISRTVFFTDGSTAKEQLLTVVSSETFSYRISEFTGINKFLVSHINGAWRFSQRNQSETAIEWTYSLVCRNKASWYIVRLILERVLTKYLEQALKIIKEDLEKPSISEPLPVQNL